MSDHSTKSFLTDESPQARTIGGYRQASTDYIDKSIYRHGASRGNGKNGPPHSRPSLVGGLLWGRGTVNAYAVHPRRRMTGASLRSRLSVGCGAAPTTTSSSSVFGFGLETALATAGILVVMVARIPDVFR